MDRSISRDLHGMNSRGAPLASGNSMISQWGGGGGESDEDYGNNMIGSHHGGGGGGSQSIHNNNTLVVVNMQNNNGNVGGGSSILRGNRSDSASGGRGNRQSKAIKLPNAMNNTGRPSTSQGKDDNIRGGFKRPTTAGDNMLLSSSTPHLPDVYNN